VVILVRSHVQFPKLQIFFSSYLELKIIYETRSLNLSQERKPESVTLLTRVLWLKRGEATEGWGGGTNCKFGSVIICTLQQISRSNWAAEVNRGEHRNPTRPGFPGTVSVLQFFQELCPGVPQNLVRDVKCPVFYQVINFLTMLTNILTFLHWGKTSTGVGHPSATTNRREYVEVSDYRLFSENAKGAERTRTQKSVGEMRVRID
jgi:hypothetical protein